MYLGADFSDFFLLPAAQAPSAKPRGQGTARAQGVRGGGAEDAVGGQAFGGICIFSQVLYSDFISKYILGH
jgi:hypothetical protein